MLAGTAVEPCSGSTDKTMGRGTEVPMKRLMICAFAAVALLAAATVILRSPPTELSAATAAMPSLQELHTAPSVNTLLIDDFEDMPLLFPPATTPHSEAPPPSPLTFPH